MGGRAELARCAWVPDDDELYRRYHDEEWGVPVHDDRTHFEFLILEGAQAGLSWRTILTRRDGYRRAFAQFDPEAVSLFDETDVARLLNDPGIIRNRQKVRSALNNAAAFLRVQADSGTFDDYLWGFTDGQIVDNPWTDVSQIPPQTELSVTISKDLKQKGFSFVGPTIVYAHLQAVGVVNDHTADCFRRSG